jgi:hypothetical protein
MIAIGLIVGHGYAKAVSAQKAASLPAVAAPALPTDFDTILGAGRRAVDLNGRGSWLVGKDALTFAPGRVVSILDRSRYTHPSFVALARAALSAVLDEPTGGERLRIFTGMPAAWYRDPEARAAIKAAVVEAARPWGEAAITVTPEVAGVYYAHAFTGGRYEAERVAGDVGVLDLGYRDGNVGLFSDGRYVAGDSIPGGAVEGLKEVKRLIAETLHLELGLHQVDAAVIAGSLLVDGVQVALPEGTAAALASNLDAALSVGRSLWPNGGRGLRALILGGGGAHPAAAALQAAFPAQLVALAEPQQAGPRGLYAAAAAAVQTGR